MQLHLSMMSCVSLCVLLNMVNIFHCTVYFKHAFCPENVRHNYIKVFINNESVCHFMVVNYI